MFNVSKKSICQKKPPEKKQRRTGRYNNRIKNITDDNIWNKTGEKETTEIRIKKIQKNSGEKGGWGENIEWKTIIDRW